MWWYWGGGAIPVFVKASASATSRKASCWTETAGPNNSMASEMVPFLVLPTTILCIFLIIPVRAKFLAQLFLINLIDSKKGEAPNYTNFTTRLSLYPSLTKYIPQHQFTHSLNPIEVSGSRGGDRKITIFR
jgi:hypothetical protein